MRVSIVGTGYVGLTAGVGFASKSHEVITVDKDQSIVNMINDGVSPIHEEGLEELLGEVVASDELVATSDTERAIKNTNVTFISVGTPTDKNGVIDLSYVEEASRDVGEVLMDKSDFHVVVIRSTVVPGTTEEVVIPVLEEGSGKEVGVDFGVCMTPEFLREGKALNDFLNPDRIVIGEFDERSGDVIEEVYDGFDAPFVRTGLKAAEMIKYASNSFLATKISFINELGNLCKELGVDTYEVADAMGLDHRINREFLNASRGFGGSCFPKDVQAIISEAKDHGVNPRLLKSVLEVNDAQKTKLVEMLEEKIDLSGRRVGVLGLAFKPGTDDVRNSPAIPIIQELKEKGARPVAYDPEAIENMKEIHPDINYVDSSEKALEDVDACLIVTGWDEFEGLSDEDLPEITLEGQRLGKGEGICW